METVSDEKHSITVILLFKIDENSLFSVNHTQNQWLLILHCSYETCESLMNTYLDFRNLYLTGNLHKLDKFLQEKWLSFSNFKTLSDKNYWDLPLDPTTYFSWIPHFKSTHKHHKGETQPLYPPLPPCCNHVSQFF